MSATLTPYLFFGGRCDEAIAYYEKALDAKLLSLMRYNESPDPVPEGMLPAGFEAKVMHAALQIGNSIMFVCDGIENRIEFVGFQLAVSVANEEEAKRKFTALAEGGTVVMPLAKTFWSPCFGMVTDRYQVCWMVMVPSEQPM